MRLSARLRELRRAIGVDAALPAELARPAAFGQLAPDLDELARWLGARCAERAAHAIPALCARPFDPLAGRVLREALRALASGDAEAALRHARAVRHVGPFEDVLRLGALGRASALVAAGAGEAEAALIELGHALDAPRPVARVVALRLGELGLGTGPLARRARALLEEALLAAIERAREVDLEIEEHAVGRVLELIAVLGALAAHREGLTQRLSALAPEVPPELGPPYVIAYLTALGSAEPGPYLREVHHRLVRAAAETEPGVRALAVSALGDRVRAHPELLDPIVEALTDADEDVRTQAALALAELPLSEHAHGELVDMVELGGSEAVLAATRTLARCGRAVPEDLLAAIDDPVARATAELLIRPDDDAAFGALLEACAEVELEDYEVLDVRVQPMAVLVETLAAMAPARAALWLRQFATGGAPVILGQVFWEALEDCDPVPRELAETAPLFAMIARGDDDRVALAALVASRLVPEAPNLEALVLERTPAPVALTALAALDRVSAATAEHVLAIAESVDPDEAALAITALARCDLGAERAYAIAELLASRVSDADPLCEPAHAALVELVERGTLA